MTMQIELTHTLRIMSGGVLFFEDDVAVRVEVADAGSPEQWRIIALGRVAVAKREWTEDMSTDEAKFIMAQFEKDPSFNDRVCEAVAREQDQWQDE